MIITEHFTDVNRMNCYFKGHDLVLDQRYSNIASDLAWEIIQFAGGIRDYIFITRNRTNNEYNAVIDHMNAETEWLVHPMARETVTYFRYKSFVVMITFDSKEFSAWHSEKNMYRIKHAIDDHMDSFNGTFYTDENED